MTAAESLERDGICAAGSIGDALRSVGRLLEPVHARVIEQRSDRRLMGSRGHSRTLCGAPMTDQDVLAADTFKGMARVRCPGCEAALPRFPR